MRDRTEKKNPTLTAFDRLPKPILTRGGELFILLAGRPVGEGYLESLIELQAAMIEAKGHFSFTNQLSKNRRGDYRAISAGVTLGGGSKVGFLQLDVGRCQRQFL